MHIYVIGDLMLDIDYTGKHRGNEECAELCLTSWREQCYPGGAAWVAWLLMRMGHDVELFGAVGPDSAAQDLFNTLPRITTHAKPLLPCTCVKRRVHTPKGLYRFDMEKNKSVSWPVVEAAAQLHKSNGGVDCVLFVDYNKGVFWDDSVQRSVDLITDSTKTIAAIKPTDYLLSRWSDVDLVSCNEREANDIGRGRFQTLLEAGVDMTVTRGGRGLYIYHGGYKTEIANVPVASDAQVVGAGDAFLAMLANCWLGGYDLVDAAKRALPTARQYVRTKRSELDGLNL